MIFLFIAIVGMLLVAVAFNKDHLQGKVEYECDSCHGAGADLSSPYLCFDCYGRGVEYWKGFGKRKKRYLP